MAKKARTTGLPKTKNVQQDATQDSAKKEFATRAERELYIQRMLVRVTIGALILVAVLVAATLIVNQVIIPNQAVASVNGENITVSEFQRRYRFEQARINQIIGSQVNFYQSQGFDQQTAIQQITQHPIYGAYYNELSFPDQLGRRVLDDLVDDKLVAQAASAQNITVNEEKVQEQINTYFGYDPTQVALIGAEPTITPTTTITPTPFVSPTPTSVPTETPTLSPEETEEPTATVFATIPPSPTSSIEEIQQGFEDTVESFRTYIQSAGGVSSSAVDEYFDRAALRDAVRDAEVNLQNPLLHVNARHILVETEEQALDIIESLNQGEPFNDLARAASVDTGSGARGGELGWGPVLAYVEGFREAVTDAEIGAIVGPVESQFGFHIIQVRAREERDVEENQLVQLKDNQFATWLDDQRSSADNTIEIYDTWLDAIP